MPVQISRVRRKLKEQFVVFVVRLDCTSNIYPIGKKVTSLQLEVLKIPKNVIIATMQPSQDLTE